MIIWGIHRMNRFIRVTALVREPLFILAVSLWQLEPCLDSSGESVEVADALDFVIGELDAEMIFDSREEFERLQAVNSELLVEIVARFESGARNFEMCRRKIQNFLGGLFDRFHDDFYSIVSRQREAMADTDAVRHLQRTCADPP
jgi:hypothetical protein